MAASLLLHTVVALDGPFNHESSKHLGIAHQRLTSYEKLHGFLLWASMGFLMPISIILIRMTKAAREQGATRRLEILYYLHVTLQVLAVTLASAGAVLSFMKFDNKFKYTHQKIGLSLYIIVWLQPIVGFLRPESGGGNPSSVLSHSRSMVLSHSTRLFEIKTHSTVYGFRTTIPTSN
eukprot:TRINITY_DN5388_c0_g1_i2.p1 TRINITY_DN5388_c0_g1~~TRINITY_DN5388_c0_g1_i2.p1  ORF type:complete len:178 (+),score=20.15 TRINITY_DN5388_c0_g1_i2:489-1022(+)